MRLVRLALRAVLPEAVAIGILTWTLAAVVGLGQQLLTNAVVPDPDLLLRMGEAAAALGGAVALPVAALGGVAAGAGRLARERAWLALRALGVGGRALAGPIVGVLLAASVAWLGVTHVAEPWARAALRDARVAAAVRVRPVEGRSVAIGGWSATVDGGLLRFAGGDWLGSAREWALRPATAGVVVELHDGELARTDGATRARFATLEVPVALTASGGKVQASERSTPDLLRQIAVSAALGRDVYERWILWKRTLLPACLPLLGLGALALALRRGWSTPVIVAAEVGTVWAAVRVADQSIDALGPVGASALTLGVASIWPLAAWLGWRDA